MWLWLLAVSSPVSAKPLFDLLSRQVQFHTETILMPDTNPALQKYSIVHLTDTHVWEHALYNRERFLQLVDQVIEYEKQTLDKPKKIIVFTWDLWNMDKPWFPKNYDYLTSSMIDWFQKFIHAWFSVYIIWWNHDFLKEDDYGNKLLDTEWPKLLKALQDIGCIVLWTETLVVQDEWCHFNIVWLPDISSHPLPYLGQEDIWNHEIWSSEDITSLHQKFAGLNILGIDHYDGMYIKWYQAYVDNLPLFSRVWSQIKSDLATLLLTHSPEAVEYFLQYSSLSQNAPMVSFSGHTHWAYFHDCFLLEYLRNKAIEKLQTGSLHGFRSDLVDWKFSLHHNHIHFTSPWIWMHPDTYYLQQLFSSLEWRKLGKVPTWSIRTILPQVTCYNFMVA